MVQSVALNDFGDESPRFVTLNAQGPPSKSFIDLQDDAFRNGLQNPATVRGYLRDLEVLKRWALSISTPVSMLNEFSVAAFLRDQSSRGSSIPNRLLHTLRWFEKVFGFDLSTSSQLVICQSHPPDRLPTAAPKMARMVLVKMVDLVVTNGMIFSFIRKHPLD